MSKILIINVPAYGHINPTLGLTKALIEAGNEVIYLSTEEFRNRIESTGAVVYTYKFNSKKPYTYENLESMYNEALNHGKNCDCIMYDFIFLLGKAVGEILNKPTVRLYSSFAWTRETAEEIFASCDDMRLKLLGKRAFRKVAFGKYIKKLNLKTNDIIDEITDVEADLNIVFTTREFQGENELFADDKWAFVGPVISDRNDKCYIPFESMKEKIIYVSLGTIFNDSVSFFKNCIEAFKDYDTTVIMSIGKKIKKEDLGEIPDNFYVSDFLPQLEILKKTDLFITHGGMNSTSEAMFFGVPEIVVPQAADQPSVGKRIEHLHLGKVLNKNKVSPERIRKYAEEILSDITYKNNMLEMSEKMKSAGGENKAVELIEALIKENMKSCEKI